MNFILSFFQNPAKEMSKMVINGETKDSKSLGVKIETKTMVGEETFHCNPTQLYRALTDKEVHCHVDIHCSFFFVFFLSIIRVAFPESVSVSP